MPQIRPRWSIPRVMLRWRSIINFSTVMLFLFLPFSSFFWHDYSLPFYLFIKSSVRSLEFRFFFFFLIRIRKLVFENSLPDCFWVHWLVVRERVVSRMTSVPLSLWYDVLFCIGEVVSIDAVLKNIRMYVCSMMWSVEIFLFLSRLFYK